MTGLFSEELLEDVRRLRGAEQSFLKQLASPEGAGVRAQLEAVAARCGEGAGVRWRELLNSLDNRRFFQGVAEVWTSSHLLDCGWQVADLCGPGPRLVAVGPDGATSLVLVLSFIRQVRPGPDAATLKRLIRALNRADARSRIGIHVRRWLPHDLDPEPIRRAVELWLREAERHGHPDRYAVYVDDQVSLEFARTDEQTAPDRPLVAFSLGPFSAQQTLERIEASLARDLGILRHADREEELPVLLSLASDQPWQLSRGWLRERLYGKARWQTSSPELGFELGYPDSFEQSLLRDRAWRAVSGVMMVDRPAGLPAASRARVYLNPWSGRPLAAHHLHPLPCLAPRRLEGRTLVLGWTPYAPPSTLSAERPAAP